MSNQIRVTPTRFICTLTGTLTYGFRISDTYATAYEDTWDDVPDDTMEVLRRVAQSQDLVVLDLVMYIAAERCPVYVGDTLYAASDYGDIFDNQEDEELC